MKKRKGYNNNSSKYSDWTSKKLIDSALSYYQLIYGEITCYGVRDMVAYDRICQELHSRNYAIKLTPSFHKLTDTAN